MDAAIEETGAMVVMGRRTFEMGDADSFVGNSAIEQARTAAGDKVVQVVGGPSAMQRLLENLDPERIRLEKLEVREVGARTSLGFRVVTR